jgi:hypothetical protein
MNHHLIVIVSLFLFFLSFISNHSDDRWNDNDESISTKKKDLNEHWKSKTKDYSADIR